MKNFIDKLFFNIICEFKNKTEKEIFENMFFRFQFLPDKIKVSYEKFLKEYPFWGKLDSKNIEYESFKLKAKAFKKNYKNYIWLYNKLQDEKSKFILYAVLNNLYNFDFNNLDKIKEKIYKQYFDLDLMPKMENEIFLDIGSYYGETTLDFISTYGEKAYKKIYCYEITPNMLNFSKNYLKRYKNIIYKNFAVSNSNKVLYINENTASSSANKTSFYGNKMIKAVSLDNNLQCKISLVKMDIEGDEYNALKGLKKHIQKETPKLLISVYHNNTDVWHLPKLIYSYNKNYKFYLRYYGGNLYATEIVLICLPK